MVNVLSRSLVRSTKFLRIHFEQLHRLGLKETLRDAIMDPQHEEIRETDVLSLDFAESRA